MTTPPARLTGPDRALWALFAAQAIVRPAEPVVLASGQTSPYYIDARRVTLSGRGVYLTGLVVARRLGDVKVIGGPATAAVPVVTATLAALAQLDTRTPAEGFFVRAEAKAHGLRHLVEGPVTPGSKAVVVDDVATSGGSLVKAVGAARAAGLDVVKVVTLLDRQAGAAEALVVAGVKDYEYVFTPADFGLS